MIFFEGNCKTKRAGQFSLINETLYKWYGKCCAAGIYPFRKLKRQLKIKESLKDSSLSSFINSNGCLEKWRAAYGIREMGVTGGADDVSIPTMKSWIERIAELVRGYRLEDIWNMDKLGLFFKLLPDEALIEKAKSKKGGKKKLKYILRLFFS